MSELRVGAVQIIKTESGKSVYMPDLLAIEEPLEIRLDFGELHARKEKSVAVTMRTPGNDLELAFGFLYTESIVTDYNQIVSIKHCEKVKEEERGNVVRVVLDADVIVDLKQLERYFYTSSSCGVCGKASIEAVRQGCKINASTLTLKEAIIHEAPKILRQAQNVFEHTGGLHAAGLFDQKGNLLMLREDVGRHNALDKLIGAMIIDKNIAPNQCFVLLSGRTSFELVQKAMVANIPMIAAVGAPSSLAVELAKQSGITLMGFVRNNSFNIYSGEQRIITLN
jgi:FdhD protein